MDDMKDSKVDEPVTADPGAPKASLLSRAAGWAAWNIRFKNRQAALNGGQRPPLGTPRIPL